MTDCYVYYRVEAAREAEARAALAAMLVDLATATGISGRIYRKVGEPLLWMEVYTAVADADALTGVLSALAAKHGLAGCLAGNQKRHIERFAPFGA